MTRTPIRIGAVAYLNTRPLVWGLERGCAGDRVQLSYDVPSALADRMIDGLLDIALLPIVELARFTDLEIVPGLAITTRGPSASVLLISDRPVDRVRRVALDPESRTSNILLRLLFADVWRRRPEFRPGPAGLPEALEAADAVVRIGDKALFEPRPPGTHVYDLGAVWTEATGLPFVFAAWAARPGVVDRELYRALHDSRRQGSRAIDRIAAEYSWRGRRDPEIASRYLRKNILFRLGAPELRAMESFLRVAADRKWIDRYPPLRLALQRRTACHEAAETAANKTPV